jgi:hypothetical protein
MLHLLAETPIPISPDATSPHSWSEIFKLLGFEGGLVILGVVMGFVLLLATGIVCYRVAHWVFGPEGWCKKLADRAWDRVEAFLTTIETRTLNSSTATDAILKTCSQSHAVGGDCNVRDFRQAAVPFLNGMVSLTEGKKAEAAEKFRDAKDQLIQIQPAPHTDMVSGVTTA